MEMLLKVFVLIVQLALGAYLAWGASLCLRAWLAEFRSYRALPAPLAATSLAEASHADFGRVASLVLLALLCTTLAGVA